MRINEQIRVHQVRLIDADGTQRDIMDTRDAQRIAGERGLDLVEIAPQAKPPVCKIMDYGKYRFEQVKREKETKKNRKSDRNQGVKLRPISFKDPTLNKGQKRRAVFERREQGKSYHYVSRQRNYPPRIGKELCARMADRLGDCSSVEKHAKVEGRNMTMILVPKN